MASKNGSVNSEAFVVKRREGTFQNKVSIEVKEGQGHGKEDKHESSEFEDQEVVVNPVLFPGTLCFPEQSNPPYDKRSYQDEDSCKDSASDVTQDDEGEGDSVLSNAEESTLIEDKDRQQGRVVFDDDDTWNDLEDTPVGLPSDSTVVSPVSKATASGVSPPERTLLRKVAVSKVVELDGVTVAGSANLEPDPPPPASQLMTRLFPSLKPRAQNAPLPPPPPPPAPSVAPESKKSVEETGEANTYSLVKNYNLYQYFYKVRQEANFHHCLYMNLAMKHVCMKQVCDLPLFSSVSFIIIFHLVDLLFSV